MKINIIKVFLLVMLKTNLHHIRKFRASNKGIIATKIFTFRRHLIALSIYHLDEKRLDGILSPGSQHSNLLMEFFEPTMKNYNPTKSEASILKASMLRLEKGFDMRTTLIALIYLRSCNFDPELKLFSSIMKHPSLEPLYIRHLFDNAQFYEASDEPDKHLIYAERVMQKMCTLLKEENEIDKRRIATYLRYYAQGSLSLLGHSDQRQYQESKALLLKEFVKIEYPDLSMIYSGKRANSLVSKKRVGIVRFSSSLTGGESRKVLSVLDNPPHDVEIFLFVLELHDADCRQLLEAVPALEGNIIPLSKSNLVESLNTLRSFNLDLLINTSPLSGRFINEIAILLACRAAPKQAMFLSDVVTSGIAEVDYFILSGPDYFEGMDTQFTESLVTTKGLVGALWLDDNTRVLPKENSTALVQSRPVNYCSNAHVMKLSPELLRTWVRILAATKNTRMILMPFPNQYSKIYESCLNKNILSACKLSKIDPERFTVVYASGANTVCKNLRRCDIYLDSFPYASSISLHDPLSVSIPIITLEGVFFRSRLASTILRELDLSEGMVTKSIEEYIESAVLLSENHSLQKKLREDIKTKVDSHHRFFNSSSDEFYRTISRTLAS